MEKRLKVLVGDIKRIVTKKSKDLLKNDTPYFFMVYELPESVSGFNYIAYNPNGSVLVRPSLFEGEYKYQYSKEDIDLRGESFYLRETLETLNLISLEVLEKKDLGMVIPKSPKGLWRHDFKNKKLKVERKVFDPNEDIIDSIGRINFLINPFTGEKKKKLGESQGDLMILETYDLTGLEKALTITTEVHKYPRTHKILVENLPKLTYDDWSEPVIGEGIELYGQYYCPHSRNCDDLQRLSVKMDCERGPEVGYPYKEGLSYAKRFKGSNLTSINIEIPKDLYGMFIYSYVEDIAYENN